MPGLQPQPPHVSAPTPVTALIGAHLEKILSSSVFKSANRLRELLRFIVNEAMAGRGGELKEYVLAVAVLGKHDSFDPKADPIVRNQMRRLRAHLDRYYAGEGQYDSVLIQIPKGRYVPTFRTAAPARGADRARGESRIVGRDQELAELHAAFESAAAGRGRMVCLTGEPGIGKTVLVEAFLRELAVSGADYCAARGRCSERLAGSEAYLPVLEALDSLLRTAGESLGLLMNATAPAWYAQTARLTDTGRMQAPGRVASQEQLKRELVDLFEELAMRQTVVIVLDDLHWADASTIDVLAYCASRWASQRILILVTYRPDALLPANHPFLQVKLELQGHGMCREVAVPLLTAADVARYLALTFPDHLLPADVSARIHRRTAGNPLFMTDLVRFLADRGVFVRDQDRWVLRGQLSEVEKALPESIRSMVDRKIGQLSDADRRVLVAASVQGYEFDSAVVSKALGMDVADIEEQLDVLERVHGFVRLVGENEFPDRTLTMRYRFAHVLYQDALYASLQPTRKSALSAAVANTLLICFGARHAVIASELAILFEAARDFERAADYFLLAAELATHVAANTEAVVLARRGLNALMMLPDSPERRQRELRIRTSMGPALMTTIGWGTQEVEANYRRARDLCAQIGEAPHLFPVIYGLWGYWHGRAEFQTAVELADQLLALAQKVEDPALLLLAHYALGNTLAVLGDWDRSRTHVEQAISFYVPEQHRRLASVYGGHDPGVVCRSGLPINLWMLGYPDAARARAGEGTILARQIDHAPSVVFALLFDAMLHVHRRDPRLSGARAEAAIALATQQDLPPLLAWGRILRGWGLVQQGIADEGIADLLQGIAGWSATMGPVFRPHFLFLLADSYARIGQVEEALASLGEALSLTAQTHEGFAEPELHRLKGELLGGRAEAEGCFRSAIDVARRQKAKSFELRAAVSFSRLLQSQGRHADARRMLADACGGFSEGFDTRELKEAIELLQELGGSPSSPRPPS